jgi:hypothetical protein
VFLWPSTPFYTLAHVMSFSLHHIPPPLQSLVSLSSITRTLSPNALSPYTSHHVLSPYTSPHRNHSLLALSACARDVDLTPLHASPTSELSLVKLYRGHLPPSPLTHPQCRVQENIQHSNISTLLRLTLVIPPSSLPPRPPTALQQTPSAVTPP